MGRGTLSPMAECAGAMWASLVAVLLVGGCSSGGSTGADAGVEGGAPALLSGLQVSTGILRPPFDPATTDYDVTSLNSLFPVTVTATTTDASARLSIHGAAGKSGVPTSFTLHPREDIHVVVSAAGRAATTYTVHYVPSDFPTYTTQSSAGAGTEDVLFTPDGQYALEVDRSGAPLYYRTFLPNDVGNFQRVTLPTGAVQYAATVGIADARGWTLGADHVMDDHFQDVTDVRLLAYAAHGALDAEGHDFRILGDQHTVAMAYVQRTLDLSTLNPAWSASALVMSAVMQEIDHGNVLVEWDSANVPSLYADSTTENAFGPSMISDYLHLNSIDVDPADGNFVVSFRHTSSIVKLDRHTAKIVWTLGGKEDQFALAADQVFSFQHDVRMQPDGSMTVFDNGNNAHQTRLLSFRLDEANHKVSAFQVLYTKPASQPPTGLMGSITPLSSGRLFVGWGGWYTSDIEPAATEIVGGAPVWSLQFSTPSIYSYRALPVVP